MQAIRLVLGSVYGGSKYAFLLAIFGLMGKLPRKFNDFDDAAKEAYIAALGECGMYIPAADSLGLKYAETRLYRNDNPEYQEACFEALERYRERFLREAEERALKGFYKPIMGGRERDRVVGEERVVSDRLLELFIKRGPRDERFTDKQEVTVSGGLDVQKQFEFHKMSKEARKKMRDLLMQLKEDEVNAEAKKALREGDPEPIVEVQQLTDGDAGSDA